MELQDGKFYIRRDGEKAEVVAILHKLGAHPVVVKSYSGHLYTYSLLGEFYTDGEQSEMDLVAEYVEPKLNLGPEHVGRRVRLRDGRISLILQYVSLHLSGAPNKHPILSTVGDHMPDGRVLGGDDSRTDIVEVLP